MSLPKPTNQAPIVITGASSGIGTELARGLARRGYPLLLVARRKERMDELAGELHSQFSVDVEVQALDLSDAAARKSWPTGCARNPLRDCATAPDSAPAGYSRTCRSSVRAKRWCSTR